MQFLVFVFILLSLLSSLRKKAKESRKKKPFFDPWSFGDEPPVDETEEALKYREEDKTEAAVLKPVEESEIEAAEEQGHWTEDILSAKEDKTFEPVLEQEGVEPLILSLSREEEIKKVTAKAIDTIASQQELKSLLLGPQLPLAIVASEILGPPRALRPIRNRLFNPAETPRR